MKGVAVEQGQVDCTKEGVCLGSDEEWRWIEKGRGAG